jgi:hypothetical protein
MKLADIGRLLGLIDEIVHGFKTARQARRHSAEPTTKASQFEEFSACSPYGAKRKRSEHSAVAMTIAMASPHRRPFW